MAPSCRSGTGGASPVSLVTPESLEQQLQGDIPVVAYMPQGADRRRLAVRRELDPFGSAERPADVR
ncbi:hypothetical protein [Streptomyces atratus]|uniref:hypothetical protein n=1 Tax=Streptomyces atratus TaxID=1893 RepID=UPI002253F7D3|nr:hypothetical protein [Streptomyces atratus]MCX5344015.1 hypothetical protein [Streptomyces atratus]